MKTKKIMRIVAVIGSVVLIMGGFFVYHIIDKNELKTYQLVSTENNSEGFIANYPQTVEEAIEQSELVVRCKIASKGEAYFVSRVNDEDKNRYQKDGAKEWQYSDVWTDCRLEVKEIYKGNCDNTIYYKFLGGTIGEYTENKGYELKEGKEYILFLQYVQEKESYQNAISSYYILEKPEEQ